MHKKIGKKYQKDEKKKDQKRFLEASLVRQADGKLKNLRLFGVTTKISVLSDKKVPLPFCEEKSVQLFRVAFFRSDFLQNPYFSTHFANWFIVSRDEDAGNIKRVRLF